MALETDDRHFLAVDIREDDTIHDTIRNATDRITNLTSSYLDACADNDLLRQLLSEAEKREKEARDKAIEEAAQVAERDVDWSAFGKKDVQPWENGNDSIRDYRLGIATGRAIAASIRALQSEER
ncbi:hypothetical protein [Agrobacterium sp.]|uniref:hypothetical protein n=1 Tax=Agrobacterium sp. TaxID=361 RepID=UPI0025BEAA9B|nr:hypothetical protein [Agrobacterium sp.]MCD4660431.1 hypothetical protein [Agrobacterium sp.]